MVKCGSFSYAGTCHGQLPECNEDVVPERACGTHKVVILCDGAGSCANGKEAARLTAEALEGFLSFRLGHCLLENPEVLRLEAANLITEVLTDAAEKAGADPSSFGCTLMAAAMDLHGRWCLFHLGDGTAVGKLSSDADWMIVSHPQRGLQAGATSLTMNGAMFRNLRFYRQVYPSDRAIFLMTDGVLEAFPILPEPEENPELLGSPERLGTPEDDCSAAWLIARQES